MVFQHQSSTIIQKHSEEYPHFELITIAPRPWMRTSMYKYSRILYMVSWSSELAYLDIICMQQRSGNKRRGSCCPCYCNSRRIMHQLCYVLRPKEGISQFCPHCDTDVPACSNTLRPSDQVSLKTHCHSVPKCHCKRGYLLRTQQRNSALKDLLSQIRNNID